MSILGVSAVSPNVRFRDHLCLLHQALLQLGLSWASRVILAPAAAPRILGKKKIETSTRTAEDRRACCALMRNDIIHTHHKKKGSTQHNTTTLHTALNIHFASSIASIMCMCGWSGCWVGD